MKAVIISAYGKADVLKIQERPIPEIADDEVLIKVSAAGINRPDIMQREGKYPPPDGAPIDIPGLEVAGYIEQIGKNVHQWRIGDAVCALLAGGGYAEYVNADAGLCLPVPEGMSMREAASLPETVFTVWSNVFERAALQKGQRILIHGGSSGIGITAIQLAHYFGAEVWVTVGSDEKGKSCLSLGAHSFINYKTTNFQTVLKDVGVDVILDMIGGEYLQANLNILKPEGRLVQINTMLGAKAQVNLVQIMQKRLTITGSTLRAREIEFKRSLARTVHEQLWPILASGKFKAVVYASFPLVEAKAAHELMESSQHIGKIVLDIA